MADFLIAHKRRLGIEGDTVSMSIEDNGNWSEGLKGHGTLIGSKYGISAPVLSAYLKRQCTRKDMAELTEETAAKIYKPNYWDIFRGDEIHSQEIANSLYDSVVNMGPREGILLAQNAIEMPDEFKTGHINNMTINILNNA